MRYSLLLLCVVSLAGCIVQPPKPVVPPKPGNQSVIEETAKSAIVNYVNAASANLDQVAKDIEEGRVKKANDLAAALKPSEQANSKMFDALYQEWNKEFAEDFSKAPQALRDTASGLRRAVK